MRRLRAWVVRWGGLFHKGRRDRELAAELESHLQMHIEDNLRAGMTPEEARRQALMKLGGVEQTKENYRDRRGLPWLETLLQDVRYGFRMLRKNPGFTTIAVLTLALGIGANTAIFSVVDAVLLKALRVPDPNRMVIFMNAGMVKQTIAASSDIEFNLFRKQDGTLEDVSGYRANSVYLTGVDQPQKVNVMFVTDNYFRLFGLPVAQGRTFTSEEEQGTGRPNENGHVAVLSDAFWKRAFGGDAHVLGRVISLGGNPYEVVGVISGGAQGNTPDISEGFQANMPDIWLPFPLSPNSSNQNHYFAAVGRLKAGVTLDAANAQLQLMTQEFRREYPNTISAKRGDTYSLQRMLDYIIRDARSSLLALFAAVGFVLLIACANVANLLLVRATSRTREMAIRTALGATRGRIIRQLLVEGLLLSAAAALLGLGMGLAGVHVLLALAPANIPRVGVGGSAIGADWRLLLFTTLIASLTGLMFGLVPAIQTSSADLNSGLKESSGRTGGGFRHNRLRSGFVIGELSLALLSLIGAGLFIRTLIALRSVDPGFDARNVVTTSTPLDPKLLKSSAIDQTTSDALGRIEDLPGVEKAAFTTVLPLDGGFNQTPIGIEGRPLGAGSVHGFARLMIVSANYFDVLKIPLFRGRSFIAADRLDAPGVAIINESMARQLWPDSDPLKDRLITGKGLGPSFEEPPRQIIGIVGDVHDNGLGLPPQPTVFIPGAQRPDARWVGSTVAWVVRTRASSLSLNAAIQKELRQATGLPVPPLRSMEEVIAQSTARQSFNMLLMTIFAGSALLLAAIGIYGVMAYLVVQRTHEIGIRVALGAQRSDVMKMVLGNGIKLALIGISIGILGALALTRFLSSMLFGVHPTDLPTFVVVTILMFGVALAACYVPARRAMRVDPMVALRHE